jgi:hypothetical protein
LRKMSAFGLINENIVRREKALATSFSGQFRCSAISR